MDAVKKGDPVAKAVADVKRGVDRLIKLLGSKDDVVSVKAHSALCGLDLPPIGALADALFKSRDPRVRAGAAGVLGAAADADKVRVLIILGHAFRSETDMAVRVAVINAMLGMKTYFEEMAEVGAARREGPATATGPAGPFSAEK